MIVDNFPTLKTYTFEVNPDTQSEIKFVPQQRYLLLDLSAPEVAVKKLQSITRANLDMYEQAVQKFFSGNFVYNEARIHQPEPRLIKYLDQVAGVINPPNYLLTLYVLEFNK